MPTPHFWRDHLTRARWFQGKGLPWKGMSIEALPWYTTGSDVWVRSELAEVRAGDTAGTYHLLVGYLPEGRGEPDALIARMDLPGRGVVDVVDAPHSPQAMAALMTALTEDDPSVPQPGGPPSVRWVGPPPGPALPTQVFSGEQSNTTVAVGEHVLFKIFRKLSPGPNLESEVMSALEGSPIVPRLIGTLSTPGRGYDLGIFSQRILHARDGWTYCVEACGADQSIADQMRDLGRTLRILHEDLRSVFPTGVVDSSVISATMLDRLDTACAQVPELAQMRNSLRAILDLPPCDVQIQRVHGDFHLGQALISPTGWTIIDFEGEPLKTPEERAAPDSVWRDVAGLVRSLDYARSTHPDSRSNNAERWYTQARGAFLDGYLDGAALPDRLLTAYEVDKAIYELVYELRNRPTWAGIPRHAIREAIAESQASH